MKEEGRTHEEVTVSRLLTNKEVSELPHLEGGVSMYPQIKHNDVAYNIIICGLQVLGYITPVGQNDNILVIVVISLCGLVLGGDLVNASAENLPIKILLILFTSFCGPVKPSP